MIHDYYLGRQPIYDGEQQVIGYELLFRQRDGAWRTPVDGDQATSRVIMHSFWELGLSRVVGNHKAFINVTRGFLLDPELLPPPGPQLVLEILEDIIIDDEVTAAVRELKARGYTIALDDFVYHEDLEPLVALADIVKLDVKELGAERLAEHTQVLRLHSLKLLAEKVETPEVYEYCAGLGFDYFQGYFLCRPRVLTGKRMPANRINALRLMAGLQARNLDLASLEKIISEDPALSYRLLRYINSAAFSPSSPIRSIRHAIVYLGENEIRRWATLLALAGIDDKPEALITTSLIRARMCELIAALEGERGKESAFIVGLFSTLDAIMDLPMEDVLTSLPLSSEITDALLHHAGPFAHALDITLSHERGDWDALEREDAIGDVISTIYLEALEWVERITPTVHHNIGQR
ncbi:MAG: HDOD domain-containing protein [Gammaproteobacteria bacterium]|jgi:EAL and modified HD-GYP domain-containing signal transduction protein|nr:HDOD domain-containing protein [Gammaproteobacteria bacterium]